MRVNVYSGYLSDVTGNSVSFTCVIFKEEKGSILIYRSVIIYLSSFVRL